MQNTFKNDTEPVKNRIREISETIGRDARQTVKLNPPVFQDATADVKRPVINRLMNDVRRVK